MAPDAAGMIKARLSPSPAFAERLANQARQMAQARATSRLLALRSDPRRWRLAGLLWPRFRQES